MAERVAVWVGLVPDLDAWEAPETALDAKMAQLGVGALQSDADPAGRIAVVILLAR